MKNSYSKNIEIKTNNKNHQLSRDLYEYAKTRIPGGTQLLSKRPEMFLPDQWPAYFSKAKGCECWDLDGRHYYDMTTNGIGACLLGFADPDVSEAVKRCIDEGSMCTLNPPEEVELADMLCEIHPWASQARFTRTGGETGAVAVRIARATTKRSLIAVCGYHGWQDWYLAANLGDTDSLNGHLLPGLSPDGVPRELKGTTLTFKYNDQQQFADIMARYGDRLAAVVMEPCRYHDPQEGFLQFVSDQTHKCGALLIFDEITIGWRLCFGGSHLKLDVSPDIAFFAKALGNGHPIGAVIGTKEAMDGAHHSFISSTYWTESVGPVAALATLKKMRTIDAPRHVAAIGGAVMELWRKFGAKHRLNISTDGYPCLAHFKFEDAHADELSTAYTQLMLDRGFLAKTMLYPTMAHTDETIKLYGKAIDEVFSILAGALCKNEISLLLKGPLAHKGFARLN
jgi:glutamate-1-semialdehyde 2,1-aminomutase